MANFGRYWKGILSGNVCTSIEAVSAREYRSDKTDHLQPSTVSSIFSIRAQLQPVTMAFTVRVYC